MKFILDQSGKLTEQIEVRIEADTVWHSQEQISTLFERNRSVFTKYIRAIFNKGELEEKSNMQKMHIPNSDTPTSLFNLNFIISAGYLVKSKQGTQFRILGKAK